VAKQRSLCWLRDLLTNHVRLPADRNGRRPAAVCLYVCWYISQNPNFTKFSVRVFCGDGSVLLWRQCNMLCTSGFVDDVTFLHYRSVIFRSCFSHNFVTPSTVFDQFSFIFMSNPSKSALPSHQTQWFQSRQFPEFCLFCPFFQSRLTYPSDHTHLTSLQLIRSTLLSRPNKLGLKCPSVCTYVRPSTKSFFDFNEI